MSNPPDESVADDFGSLVEIGDGTLPGAGLPDAVVLLHSLHNGLLLGYRAGKRFLGINVFLVAGGFGGNQFVPMVGNSQHDSVDVFPRHHLPKIVVGLAV